MTVGARILTLKRTHRALEDESWRLRQRRGEREVDESPDALHLRLERVQGDHKVDAPSWKPTTSTSTSYRHLRVRRTIVDDVRHGPAKLLIQLLADTEVRVRQLALQEHNLVRLEHVRVQSAVD